MEIFDIPGWAEGVYGFSKKDLTKGLPDGRTRRNQTTQPGAKLWRERGYGEQAGYEFMPVAIGGVQLWNPVMRLIGRKTIVETPMVERDGSVKEVISLDDYVINIRGVIKNTSGMWPEFEIQQLYEMWATKEVVPIESAKTSIFMNGNEYVLITNVNLPENPGKVQSALYEIECVSDIPFVLELE